MIFNQYIVNFSFLNDSIAPFKAKTSAPPISILSKETSSILIVVDKLSIVRV